MLATAWRPDLGSMERLLPALRRVTLGEDQIVLQIEAAAMAPDALADQGVSRLEDGVISVRIAFHMRRKMGAMILAAPDLGSAEASKVDRALVRAVVLAKTWAAQLESGQVPSVKALARNNGLCHHYAARLLPLAYLAPDLADAILKGNQPRAATLARLSDPILPLEWAEQRKRFEAIGG